MNRSVDRLVINLALLMLALLIVGKLIDVAFGLLGHFFARVGSTWVGALLVGLGALLVAVGLAVRGVRLLAGGGRSGHDQAAKARQTRQSVRRPAREVPVMSERAIPVDRDPALNDWEK